MASFGGKKLNGGAKFFLFKSHKYIPKTHLLSNSRLNQTRVYKINWLINAKASKIYLLKPFQYLIKCMKYFFLNFLA